MDIPAFLSIFAAEILIDKIASATSNSQEVRWAEEVADVCPENAPPLSACGCYFAAFDGLRKAHQDATT